MAGHAHAPTHKNVSADVNEWFGGMANGFAKLLEFKGTLVIIVAGLHQTHHNIANNGLIWAPNLGRDLITKVRVRGVAEGARKWRQQ